MRSEERASRPMRRARLAVLFATLGLVTVGILFVHSTTADGEDFPSRAAGGQLVKAAVGILGLLFAARLDYRSLERWAYAIYGALTVVLAGMLAVRFATGGMNRFISFDLFQIQPSEPMKVGLILAVSRFLRFREDQGRVAGLFLPFLITIVPMALVLLQPNLGLSLMFPPILLGLLLVAGSKPRHLIASIFTCVFLVLGAYFLGDALPVPLLQGYQRNRLESFFSPGSQNRKNDLSFQVEQSLIAVGSGGSTGKGYLEGTQNLLDHVPEKETDFIFSIVAEELGFAGAAGVVCLYGILVTGMLGIAMHTREPFGRLAASGFAVAFAAQSFENIGMTLGLTPVTGIALPLVSLAGSNLVVSLVTVGIVVSISRQQVLVVAPRDLDPVEAKRFTLLEEDKPGGLLSNRWATD